MVNNKTEKLNDVFTALSDPTRRAMLQRLSRGEMPVMELASPFDISKPAITKHLKMLERAGLLKRRVEGRVHWCRLEPKPLNQAAQWISFYENFWNDKFGALDAHLAKSRVKNDGKV